MVTCEQAECVLFRFWNVHYTCTNIYLVCGNTIFVYLLDRYSLFLENRLALFYRMFKRLLSSEKNSPGFLTTTRAEGIDNWPGLTTLSYRIVINYTSAEWTLSLNSQRFD